MNLNEFKNYLKLHLESNNSRVQYYHRIKMFFEQYNEFNQETVNDFLAKCVDKGLKAQTFNGYMTALKHYARFKKLDIEFANQKYVEEEDGNFDDFLTKKEIEEEILPYFDLIFETPIKFKTIIRFLFTTGIRPKELINLQKEDFNFKNNSVKIRHTKTKKNRTVYISKKIKSELEKIIQTSTTQNIFDMTKKQLYHIFEKCNKELRYKKHLHLYQLRHSFAHHALKNGIDIIYLQKLMGHSDIKTTMKYLKLLDSELKEAYMKKFKY